MNKSLTVPYNLINFNITKKKKNSIPSRGTLLRYFLKQKYPLNLISWVARTGLSGQRDSCTMSHFFRRQKAEWPTYQCGLFHYTFLFHSASVDRYSLWRSVTKGCVRWLFIWYLKRLALQWNTFNAGPVTTTEAFAVFWEYNLIHESEWPIISACIGLSWFDHRKSKKPLSPRQA